MYYVYILVNSDKTKYYIGFTSDLRRRFQEHRQGKSYWSKRLLNPELYYYEAYQFIEQAKEREKKLKQYGSSLKGLLKRIKLNHRAVVQR